MPLHTLLLLIGIGLIGLQGCAAQSEVMTLDLRATRLSPDTAGKKGGELRVAVTGFEDKRPDRKSFLGVYHHRWAEAQHLNVPGGRLDETMPKLVAGALQRKGWQAHVAAAVDVNGSGGPDITVSGTVRDLWIDIDGYWFMTEIKVKSAMLLEVRNRADGSIVRMTVNGDGMQRVFWFDPDDAQVLLSDLVVASMGRLVSSTRVEGHALRLK